MVQTRQVQDRGRMEIPNLSGSVSVVTPLDLRFQWVSGSGVFHQFHWCCRGWRVFVLVQKNNNTMMHTNLNCKIVQESTKSTYNMISLKNTTKGKNNENLPGKNLQKIAEKKLKIPAPIKRN